MWCETLFHLFPDKTLLLASNPVISTHRHLQYAAGFIELGMFEDAVKELNAVVLHERESPSVLTVWIDVHMHTSSWENVIVISEKLTRASPADDKGWVSWAFALRELNRIEEARAVLLEAMPLHGKSCDLLHYNLACYECLLGNLPAAKRYLKTATQKDKHWKEAALDDPDLEALWPDIRLK